MEPATFARECELCLELLAKLAVERFGPEAVRRVAFGVADEPVPVTDAPSDVEESAASDVWSLASRIDFDE